MPLGVNPRDRKLDENREPEQVIVIYNDFVERHGEDAFHFRPGGATPLRQHQ
jgi:hypothetical protein